MRSTTLLFAGYLCALTVSGFWGCGAKKTSTSTTGSGGGGASAVATTKTAAPASASGPASGAGGMMMPTKLGAACSADTDCDEGGRCITAASNSPVLNGGAANGYCTKDCLKPADCPGSGSTCVVPQGADKGECLLGCEIGPALMSFSEDLSATKCHGREDVKCVGLQAGPVCVPTCGKDSQCGQRKCSLRSGACVDMQAAGKATGAACDKTTDCAGYCQGFVDEKNMPTFKVCAQPCVLGGVGTLMDTADCGGLDKGLCIFKASMNGAGDWGACSNSCLSQDDCYAPNIWCKTFFGDTKWGYCLFVSDCKLNEDCKQKGTSCIDTKLGKKCLDLDAECVKNMGTNCKLQYPLGKTAPATGTGGAGGSGSGGAGGA